MRLELGLCVVVTGRIEGISRDGAGRVLALLASQGHDAGHMKSRKGGGERKCRLG
jgi:hypothetical protein